VQVCGLKLVESQLLASLAAAGARSDAATLRAQRLAAALEAAATATAAASAADARHAPAAPSTTPPAAGADSSSRSLAVELAGLQAQLLARDQEVFVLQDTLRQAQQLAAARELEGAALQAQLAEACSASSAAQASDAAALAAQRAALTAAAAAEEARLRREMQVCAWGRVALGLGHVHESLWSFDRCVGGVSAPLQCTPVVKGLTGSFADCWPACFAHTCRICASSCSSRAAPPLQPWRPSGLQLHSRLMSRLQQQPSLLRPQQQLRCMLLRCARHCWRASWR
jgi:hypothetical protein